MAKKPTPYRAPSYIEGRTQCPECAAEGVVTPPNGVRVFKTLGAVRHCRCWRCERLIRHRETNEEALASLVHPGERRVWTFKAIDYANREAIELAAARAAHAQAQGALRQAELIFNIKSDARLHAEAAFAEASSALERAQADLVAAESALTPAKGTVPAVGDCPRSRTNDRPLKKGS